MLDSVNLERMGIPSVVVVAEQFVAAAEANARVAGLPDVPFVVVSDTDYMVEDDARIRSKLEPLVDQILERLFVRPAQG